jgi:peptidyl-prolyl cis-trans isomerase C
MTKNHFRPPRDLAISLTLLLAFLLIAGCGRDNTETPPPSEALTLTPTSQVLPSDTPLPPTPTATPEPLAAQVNGEPVTLAEYESELGRYLAAAGITQADETARQLALEYLVDELLLAQSAYADGFQLAEADLQARLDDLIAQVGGAQAFTSWLVTNQYDEASFRRALTRSIAAAWMRDRILENVPLAAEQVHARQVLLFNRQEAQEILDRLNSGANFATIVAQVDPFARGELGWFPQGYLLEPLIEAAAFSLEPGEHSDIIETRLGFHIIQVIERQDNRPLEPDALQALRRLAVQNWLADRRSQSQIELHLP